MPGQLAVPRFSGAHVGLRWQQRSEHPHTLTVAQLRALMRLRFVSASLSSEPCQTSAALHLMSMCFACDACQLAASATTQITSPACIGFCHVSMVCLCYSTSEASARSPGIKEASHEVLGCTAHVPWLQVRDFINGAFSRPCYIPCKCHHNTVRDEPAAGTSTQRRGGQTGMHTASMNVQLPSAMHDMGGWHIILS